MLRLSLIVRDIVCSIISLIVNTFYCIRYARKLPNVIFTVDQIKFDTIDEVRRFISNFEWTRDRFWDWQPWIVTLFLRGLHDDCDGAAVFGKWCLGKLGIKGKIASLWNTKSRTGHAICLALNYRPGKHLFISNGEIVKFEGENWRNALICYFKEYDVIQIGWRIENLN